MCDEGRFGWKYIHDQQRLTVAKVRRGAAVETPMWENLTGTITYRFEQHVEHHGSDGVFCVLSPMMSCEEAWLLASFMQKVAPQVTLVTGHVPVSGEDQAFPVGATGDDVKFTIRNEKCPNRRGVEMVIAGSGCPTASFDEFVERASKGEVTAAWVVGGYPDKLADGGEKIELSEKIKLLVVQDLFESKLTDAAAVVLPSCAFAERSGCFVNVQGRIQPFEPAVRPPDGTRRDGQYLYELAGHEGVFNAARVRELMAATMPQFAALAEAPPLPIHQH